MIYLCNTYSLHMMGRMFCGEKRTLEIERISAWDAGRLLRENAFRSFFGHRRSAQHLSRYLHVKIPMCRGTIELRDHDVLLAATIQSKREWEAGAIRS